jgi:hypothetical protein
MDVGQEELGFLYPLVHLFRSGHHGWIVLRAVGLRAPNVGHAGCRGWRHSTCTASNARDLRVECPYVRNEPRKRAFPCMEKKYAARIENIVFLDRIGSSLRWATDDIAREELPEEILLLLRRLDRLEAQAKSIKGEPR